MNEQYCKRLKNYLNHQIKKCTDEKALASFESQLDYVENAYKNLLTPEEIEARRERLIHLKFALGGTTTDNRKAYHQKKEKVHAFAAAAALTTLAAKELVSKRLGVAA